MEWAKEKGIAQTNVDTMPLFYILCYSLITRIKLLLIQCLHLHCADL